MASSGSLPVAHRLAAGESYGPIVWAQYCGMNLLLTIDALYGIPLSGTATLLF